MSALATTRHAGDTPKANRLGMHKSQAMRAYAAARRSERKTAKVLQVSRGAVRRHLGQEGSNGTKAPTGSATKLAPEGERSRSQCEGLRKRILEQLDLGPTAIRIPQDLQAEHGFAQEYSSVRRYVLDQQSRTELPYPRMETARGYELQVDYGTVTRCRDASSTPDSIRPTPPGQIFKFVPRGRGPAARWRTAQRQLAGGTARSRPDFPQRATRPPCTFPVGEPESSRGLPRSSYPGLRATPSRRVPYRSSFRSETRLSLRNSPPTSLSNPFRIDVLLGHTVRGSHQRWQPRTV